MANLNVDALFQKMFEAGAGSFKEHWPAVQTYAQTEFKKIAVQLVDIEKGVLDGSYSQNIADGLVRLQKIASANVILATSGMTLLAVEAAINAVLEVLQGAVNTAVGFVLI